MCIISAPDAEHGNLSRKAKNNINKFGMNNNYRESNIVIEFYLNTENNSEELELSRFLIASFFAQENINCIESSKGHLIFKETNTPILLVGLNNQTKDENSLQNAYSYFTQEIHNPDIFSITLTHEPDTVDLIDPTKTQLILAGHSHNGSVRIPFINKSIFNKEGAKKYNQDYYKVNNNDLYISSGLGTNNYVGFRLFCRPTISLYRISNK